jgi:hypothetical protein
MRAPLLCALGVSLWCSTVAARQPTPSAALPPAVRAHVQNERFDTVSSLNGLPAGVRAELRLLFGSETLDIVDPGRRFQEATTAGSTLPIRRLVSAGCSRAHCLIHYERGGDSRVWRVVLFHWTGKATSLEWGGIAPGALTRIEDVRSAVLGGRIRGSAGPW